MTAAAQQADPGGDRRFMDLALALGRRGLGRVWPNPAVGCVLVRDGRILGAGHTAPGGRPHAEAVAIAQAHRLAPGAARGATAYVTLEPCSHHGVTPPCADALITAGVARVVVAIGDPDPRVSGRGLSMLRAAGVVVNTGLGAAQARFDQAGFLSRVTRARPLVTVKLATSLDARIATGAGASQWITGDQARARGHLLRASHDAILVGSGTVLADDPDLTCRLDGLEDRSPVRVVLDRRLRMPATARLAATAPATPTWVVTAADAPRDRWSALEAAGVRVLACDPPDMAAALAALAAAGITRVLAEGGSAVVTALAHARLIDRIAWFRAPDLIGGDGLPALGGIGVARLDQALGLTLIEDLPLGRDRYQVYVRREEEPSPCSPA